RSCACARLPGRIHPDVGVLPLLLRGRLPRALHRRRADAPDQARLPQSSDPAAPVNESTSPLGRGRAATLVSRTGEGARVEHGASALTRAGARPLPREEVLDFCKIMAAERTSLVDNSNN